VELPRLDRAALNFKGKGNALRHRNELRFEGMIEIATGERRARPSAIQEFAMKVKIVRCGNLKTERVLSARTRCDTIPASTCCI
jgi:hypothetical protein